MNEGLELSVSLPDGLIGEIVARVKEQLDHPQRRFLSKPALAAHYGVSPRTIKTWRGHGLPGRKVGREVMFDLDEVDRWIDSGGRS